MAHVAHSVSVFSHLTFRVLERRVPPCPADELDISQSLLKALESDSDSPPWPSLHVNMDKVRHILHMLLSCSANTMRCLPSLLTFLCVSPAGRGEAAVRKVSPPSCLPGNAP